MASTDSTAFAQASQFLTAAVSPFSSLGDSIRSLPPDLSGAVQIVTPAAQTQGQTVEESNVDEDDVEEFIFLTGEGMGWKAVKNVGRSTHQDVDRFHKASPVSCTPKGITKKPTSEIESLSNKIYRGSPTKNEYRPSTTFRRSPMPKSTVSPSWDEVRDQAETEATNRLFSRNVVDPDFLVPASDSDNETDHFVQDKYSKSRRLGRAIGPRSFQL
jgi:hypothetical protein